MFDSSQTALNVQTSSPTSGLTWQQELALAVSDVSELLNALELDPGQTGAPDNILKDFPLRVPRGYISRMRKRDFRDPLLRQVLPVAQEALKVPRYHPDPVGDLDSARAPGVLMKYHGRALLIVTGACGVHCRYCFRRAYPYSDASVNTRQIDEVLRVLTSDRSVTEVILSGGDPLSLSNDRIESLLTALNGINHLKRVRIHTRLPIVLPERVDPGLLSALAQISKPLVFVVHCNHANEIDSNVADAMSKLVAHAEFLLNQAVLLREVNDSENALIELSERLFDVGVTPYYLHQLDPVQGAAHFEVPDWRARQLIGAAAAKLPGYLVPKLVRETPGAAAKSLLTPF